MDLSTLFIDLDDTLYPASSGLWPAIRERMARYMHERLGLAWEVIPDLRRQLFLQYGTTLRGLQSMMAVDVQDYLAFVHDLPLNDYITPDLDLRRVLLSYPQRKYIFTNADSAHARRVIACLGLEGCFDGIVDILALDPYCKPMPEAFQVALQAAGETDPNRCLLADDAPRNLVPARELGFHTVLVGGSSENPDSFPRLNRLADLPDLVLPGDLP
jgi:putative hydrolase of the HAD superfamily